MPGKLHSDLGTSPAMTLFNVWAADQTAATVLGGSAHLADVGTPVDISKAYSAFDNHLYVYFDRTDSAAAATVDVEIWAQFNAPDNVHPDACSLDGVWVKLETVQGSPGELKRIKDVPAAKLSLVVTAVSAGTWTVHESHSAHRQS